VADLRFDRYLRSLTPEEKNELTDRLLEEAIPAEPAPEPEIISITDVVEEDAGFEERAGQLDGLSTGLANVDLLTGGLAPAEVTIVFAYTSHGKSQFVQAISANVAKQGEHVHYIPLEQTRKQVKRRIAKMVGDQVMGLPITFPKKPDVKITDLDALLKVATRDGAKLVIIDQLQQLISGKKERTTDLEDTSGEVSRLAKVHNVHIILVSHVSRSGSFGAPKLSDLKGSSAIEQDAHMCIAVYRNHDALDEDERNTLLVHLRKNRERGMQYTEARLHIGSNMELTELKESSVFPGNYTT
jgi:replicative DNA helicase